MRREIHHDHATQASAGEDLEIRVTTVIEEQIEIPCYAVDPVALQRRVSRRKPKGLENLTCDDQAYACIQE